jgi:hypothetical protein
VAGIFREEKQPDENAQRITGRGMLLLLSVTQPGQISIDLCSFATLVHTRCALIVSGAAQIAASPKLWTDLSKLSKHNSNVSTRFIKPWSNSFQISDNYGRILPREVSTKFLNYCQLDRQGPPLSLFCNKADNPIA